MIVVDHAILPHFQSRNEWDHGTAFSWGNMACMLFNEPGLELTSSYPNPRLLHGPQDNISFQHT